MWEAFNLLHNFPKCSHISRQPAILRNILGFRFDFWKFFPKTFPEKVTSTAYPAVISFYSAWRKHYCLEAFSQNGNVIRNSEKSSSTSSVFNHNAGSSVFLLQTFSFQRSQESRDRKGKSSCQNPHKLPLAHIWVPVTKPTATMPSFSTLSPEAGLKCFTLLLEEHH